MDSILSGASAVWAEGSFTAGPGHMRRPIIESGEARVIVYASKAGQNVTAMDLIKACENRTTHMKRELAEKGLFCTKVDKLAMSTGDIEIIAKWAKCGIKQTKRNRPDSIYNILHGRRRLL